MTDDDALVPAGAARAPLPAYSPSQLIEGLTAYREMQSALDRVMPEQIIRIAGRPYRKHGYWRAIAVGFNVTVEPLEERRAVQGTFADGRENFGYLVTCRATAPNGRTATGDGACFAVEKAARFKCPHPHPTREGKVRHHPAETCPAFTPQYVWQTLPVQASEHFVRSHAHTRAYNRAVSNLVGFAETPAEEVETEDHGRPSQGARRSRRPTPPAQAATIDAAQQRRLFERVREAGLHDDQALRDWFAQQGIRDTREIPVERYDELVDQLLIDRPGSGIKEAQHG